MSTRGNTGRGRKRKGRSGKLSAANSGICPCEGPLLPCEHRPVCATGLACGLFLAWVADGHCDLAKPRIPTRSIFELIYEEDS
jgi:hypothetical protein